MHDDSQPEPLSADRTFTVELEPITADKPVLMWFEIVHTGYGWADIFLGPHNGSRGVTQSLRLTLSNAFCPFIELTTLAERAATFRDLPFSFEIGPSDSISAISLRPGPVEGTAIFEVRETYDPVVFFAAMVSAQQFGLALAHALRVAIEDPANHRDWVDWSDHITPKEEDAFHYFGNA